MRLRLILCVLLIACRPVAKSDSLTSSMNSAPGSQAIIQSRIVDNSTVLLRSRTTVIPGGQSLRTLNFTNDKTGWIGSSTGVIYKTSDGGGSWQRMLVPADPNIYVSSIYFADEVNGWAILAKNASDVMNSSGYESEVQHTNDGGINWQRQYFGSKLQIARIQFLNKQEGWVTGRNLEKGAFVLHTTDEGRHWTDATGNLSTDYGTDVTPLGPGIARLVTARGNVLLTNDSGSSWHQVEALQGEPLQSRISKIGITPSGGLWFLGGTDSKEGVWTTLAARPSTGETLNYRLNGVHLLDAIFLGDSQIVAGGSMVSDPDESEETRKAVILYSKDGGSIWTVAYENKDIGKFNALVRQGNNLWAVGDHGLIVRLESRF
ncbi:MAG TPA: YCF48-related protein [Pyrinomonadaceae bacterium]